MDGNAIRPTERYLEINESVARNVLEPALEQSSTVPPSISAKQARIPLLRTVVPAWMPGPRSHGMYRDPTSQMRMPIGKELQPSGNH